MTKEIDATPEALEGLVNELATDFFETPLEAFCREEVGRVEADTRERFEAGRRPDGAPQTPLAPSTVQRKGHDQILIEERRLLDSLTDSGHPDAVVEVVTAPGSAEFTRGTAVGYAGHHQRGTSRIPERPPVGLSPTAADEIAERLADALVEGLKRAD